MVEEAAVNPCPKGSRAASLRVVCLRHRQFRKAFLDNLLGVVVGADSEAGGPKQNLTNGAFRKRTPYLCARAFSPSATWPRKRSLKLPKKIRPVACHLAPRTWVALEPLTLSFFIRQDVAYPYIVGNSVYRYKP